jgi:hypothetical protein
MERERKRKGPIGPMPGAHTPREGGGGGSSGQGKAQGRQHSDVSTVQLPSSGQYVDTAWLPHRRRPAYNKELIPPQDCTAGGGYKHQGQQRALYER